jgi:hypothetical protein
LLVEEEVVVDMEEVVVPEDLELVVHFQFQDLLFQ